MIDSANLMLVAIPTTGLQCPRTDYKGITDPAAESCKRILGPNENFAPVKGQTIITENGYAVHIPHMLGSETNVKKLGGGYYLVTTRTITYGSKPKTKIMTEEELVEKYNGKRVLLGQDDNSAEVKLQKAILQLLSTEPKICYEA